MSTNDDQNLKKLTERMVAMSPEPPPFPEEVTMSSPARNTTMRPLTVFAGALVLVLLGFGIPFILMNSGDSAPVLDTSTTTTVPVGSTSTEATTTTSDGTTDSTEPTGPVADFGTIVFVYTESVDSYLGNPALVPFDTFVSAPTDANDVTVIKETINMLGNPDLVLPTGFENAVPAGVEALDVRTAEGADNALIIEMNEKFLDGAGGLLGDFTMLNQLIYTATIGGQYEEVQFIVNNQQVTEFGSEGLDLSSSVNRETYQENLALIYLTSPILPNGDGNYVVEGISNTFEAALTLRVLDADGNIVHEEPGTATCGSGCWGVFTFVLDPDLIEAGTSVQLVEYSAKDGSPQNVITVPISVDEPWNLLP